MMNKIYIYGGNGHGLVVADIAKACGYKKIIFVDDNAMSGFVSFEMIKENNDIPIALGVGNNMARKKLFKKVEDYGFNIETLIHPNAVISANVTIGKGTVIMPRVVINTKSKIGKGVILNTASIIEHDNIIKDFVHISPNVALGGNVTIDDNTHIGIGSNIIHGLKVGQNCMIGAGSIVVRSIGDNQLCFGNPCKVIKEIK